MLLVTYACTCCGNSFEEGVKAFEEHRPRCSYCRMWCTRRREHKEPL